MGSAPEIRSRGRAPGRVAYRIALRSPVAVDHLELVRNGQVVKSFRLSGDRRVLDAKGELEVDAGGWLLLRAWNDGADPQVLDIYPYATTSPIYLQLPGGLPPATGDAAYFAAWMERVLAEAGLREDYNSPREREETLTYLKARARPISRPCPLRKGWRRMRLKFSLWFVATLASPALAAGTDDRFGPDDLARIAEVAEPETSPDGRWIAYTVSTTNIADDKKQSDLWRVDWDGKGRQPLTQTPDKNESHPQWSPDRRSIAFLSDRGGEDAETQVWIMDASGGSPRQLTDFPEGVEDFVWAPDGQRLAIIAWDPERPKGAKKPKNPPPIVTDRFQFKEDGIGYLTARRKHLYLFDLALKKAELLTPGDHDEQLPSWSPDGRQIAYVTKRGADPDRHLNYDIYLIAPEAGAKERQLTSFRGSDLDPYWESRPSWSPDGKTIAYLRSGEDKWIYYAPWQLALVDVASGKESLPAPIDRNFFKPRWSPDGRFVLALIEQNRVTQLSRIDIKDGTVTPLTNGRRFDTDFSVAADGRIVVLGGDALHPPELSAIEPDGPRALSNHNDWLKAKRLAPVENIEFKSADGTRNRGLPGQAGRLPAWPPLPDDPADPRRPGLSVQP